MELHRQKVGIVVGRFNEIVTSRLKEGALRALQRKGIEPVQIVVKEVPGCFELPLMAKWLIEEAGCVGVIALGAVIRGSTDHYDYVCGQTASGLMSVQLSSGRPVGFGVLTCDTLEQAFDRAGGKLGNKGAECAETIMEMCTLKSEMTSVLNQNQVGSK